MVAGGQSPASSPRLPSPPPMAEDQLGPTSPGVSLFDDGLSNISSPDTGAARRIRPGTKAEDMAEGPPLIELQDIDSAFPLTEHLKALHYAQTYDETTRTTSPITAEIARLLAIPPRNTSQDIWLYELGRFLIQKTNSIIVGLFADLPACSALTCPEMRASEWQYLCAVHDPPKSCSAIDYCCHTLDWAATTLTSSKMFPSRLGLGSGAAGFSNGGNDKVLLQQMKELTNIFRRVYRIYAHAWFQHREMFWRVEGKTGLYRLFKTVCDMYGLIQPENYTIPPEAEGLEAATEEHDRRTGVEAQTNMSNVAPIVLKRDAHEVTTPQAMEMPPNPAAELLNVGSDTTKRHRHTKSDHVKSVTTVIQEEAEEEEEGVAKPSLDRTQTVLKTDEPQAAKAPPEVVAPPSVGTVPETTVAPSTDAGLEGTAEDDETEVTIIHDGDALQEDSPAKLTAAPEPVNTNIEHVTETEAKPGSEALTEAVNVPSISTAVESSEVKAADGIVSEKD